MFITLGKINFIIFVFIRKEPTTIVFSYCLFFFLHGEVLRFTERKKREFTFYGFPNL